MFVMVLKLYILYSYLKTLCLFKDQVNKQFDM